MTATGDRAGGSMKNSQAGFSLVGLAATCTIMLILMGAAVPSWQYVMKDMREEELIFRGGQIADAIQRYQAKNANTSPPSLEVLVKGKFLRQAYKDPMSKDGKWRFIRQGEMVPTGGTPGAPGQNASPAPGQSPSTGSRPSPSPSASTSTSAFDSPSGSSGSGGGLGAIIGVATTSKDKSLRIFNGRTRYDEWLFIAGQPRVVGLHPGVTVPGPAPGQSPTTGQSPAPSPSTGTGGFSK